MNETDVARASSQSSQRAIAIAMGASLALSGGIHAVVVRAHLREWWVAGAFFVAAAIVQAACAYTVLVWRDARGARVGAVVSALLVAVWAISRTVGIPVGPGRGVREAVAGLDLIAASAEIFAVVAFLALKTRRMPRGLVSRMSRVVAVAIVGLTFGLGAATAAAMPAHRHTQSDEEQPHGSGAHEHPKER